MPVAVSKWCSYIVAPLYRLCVPSGFGGRAEFGENTSHVFHSECAEMVGVGLEEEGLHVGQGQVSATRAEALRVGSEVDWFLLSASPPPPSRRPSAPKRARARAREAGNIIWFRSGYRV